MRRAPRAQLSAPRQAATTAVVATVAIAAILGNQRHPASSASWESPAGVVADAAPPSKLRIGLWNVHGGRSLDGEPNLDAVASQIREARLDLVGLNEVYGAWRGDDYAAQLGRQVELEALFAPSERRWGRDSFGNGLLTRFPLELWRRDPLPRESGNGYRNRLLARLPWGDQPLTILVTHLDREGDQARQIDLVADEFRQLEGPAILMGDLNLDRSNPTLQRLLAEPGVVDAMAEAGAPVPTASIDWIVARGVRVTRGGQLQSEASDHPLLWVEIERPSGG